MFNKLFKTVYKKISFEDLQIALSNSNDYIILNTLPTNRQMCLIKNTLPYQTEETVINEFLNNYDFESKKFIIYGENTNDDTVDEKYSQITGLGFTNVYLYRGGMFEWLTLQDIYGTDEFPTTSKLLDILQYKPKRIFTP